MASFLPSPYNVSLTSFAAWTDIDCTTIPGWVAGSAGVLVEMINTGAADRQYGVRKNGSTDARISFAWGATNGNHHVMAIGLDGSGIFEGYAEANDCWFFVRGFLSSTESTFFTNAVDKSIGATSAWTDVDVSGDTGADTAIGVYLEHAGGARQSAARKNGSTDDRRAQIRGYHGWYYTGVDASEIFEHWISITDADLFLVGYQTSGAVFYTNARDRSTATTGSYQTISVSHGATGALYDVYLAVGATVDKYHLRQPGSVEDHYYGLNLHAGFITACDPTTYTAELKIELTDVDTYEQGYYYAATYLLQVATSADDSHQQSGTNDLGRAYNTAGACSLTNTSLLPGSHGANDEWSVAIRFPNCPVAALAPVLSARLVLTPKTTWASAGTIALHVSGQAHDNAPALSASADDLRTSNRTRTTAGADPWVQSAIVAGVDQSLDVTAQLVEIINRAGYAATNAVAFLIDTAAVTTLGEFQDYQAYDGDPALAPRLFITIGVAGVTASTPAASRALFPKPLLRTRQP